ncbi:hypothetical protein LZC95_05245 [Pendulispora brunnea]|uniref:Uncharacterized protein n=1 Tax=Pendulispora brunnea TaxID=2905690 RepID=A0ABZ2KC61_9BACT
MDWEHETISELRYSQGYVEGWTDAQVRSILLVLEARDVEVSSELRERLFACRTPEQLEAWLRLAATARGTSELAGGPSVVRALVARVEFESGNSELVVKIVPSSTE